ncbi:ScbR family autoregulator-binding transcription factor [Streptomyces sp.]|uniref:ScbR family autoregulator-binding transcription factor n=1 Tax=Streptomyces sp. TaxID=1931 RepID=UPI002D2ECED1|nr:ScbR family autoregulator-binding transcription factor [Streptomyces sp.]HZF92305.1 ScbR family autoregulator-binding transcription factor [Streptomyces sp.]
MAKQERAIRTRNALLDAAAELFDQDGVEASSLAVISARAGVSSGALNFHFASKAALVDAVVTAAGERLERITRPRDALSLQVLIDASHDLVQGLAQDVVLRAGFALSARPDRTEASRDLRRDWQAWVETTVERAAREGALMPGVAPGDLATAVVAVAAGLEALGGRDRRWLERSTLTRFWALLLPRVVGPAARELFVALGRPGAEPVPYGAPTAPRGAPRAVS